jgi:hypothetical protein
MKTRFPSFLWLIATAFAQASSASFGRGIAASGVWTNEKQSRSIVGEVTEADEDYDCA